MSAPSRGLSLTPFLLLRSGLLEGCAFPFGIGCETVGRRGISIAEAGFRYDSAFEFASRRQWNLAEAKVNPATAQTVAQSARGGSFAAFWPPRSRNLILTGEWT